MADITIGKSLHRQALAANTEQRVIIDATDATGGERQMRITNHGTDATGNGTIYFRWWDTTNGTATAAAVGADGTDEVQAGMWGIVDLPSGNKTVSLICATANTFSIVCW